MQKKFWKCIARSVIEITLLLSVAFEADGKGFCKNPFDKNEIDLLDGRKLSLERESLHRWMLSLKSADRSVLWQKSYSEDFDSLWNYAYFIKVKGDHYIVDLDNDGFPEVAISTWDGGNGANRPAIVFSVRAVDLSVLKVVSDYPVESCRPLFR